MRPIPRRPARGIGAARGFALFALVTMAEAVVARRFDLIDTPTLYATLGAVLIAGVAAGLCAAVALGDVWREGAPGGGAAVLAALLVVLTLAPFGGAIAGLVAYPPVYDVTTDRADPPRLRGRAADAAAAPALEVFADVSAAAAAYPDLVTRRLPLSTVEAHAASHLAAVELGWTIVRESEPAGEGDAGVIEAEARALFLGIPDDVVVRILPSDLGSRVDVRSASRFPAHDLGENARRIRAFFAKLDEITTRPAAG